MKILQKNNFMKQLYFIIAFYAISMTLMSQVVIKNCISGNCNNGWGKAEVSGGTYEGYFQNAIIHGKGATFTYSNGDVFKGEFRNGKINCTDGEYNRSNGDKIANCVFVDGVLKNGRYIFKNGDVYEGGFEKWKFTGKATFTYNSYSDKLHYIGEFENNMKNGQGCLTYRNGAKDDGEWKDDVFQGDKGKLLGRINGRDVILKQSNVSYNNKSYSVFFEPKFKLSKKNIQYFFLKDNYDVVGIIEVNNMSTINTGNYNPDWVSLNTNSELLKHINRNKHNKQIKGNLTLLAEDLYYDENKCIWKIILQCSTQAIDCNPAGKIENIKFIRHDPSDNGSFETVLKPSQEIIKIIENGNIPTIINGNIVTTGQYQGTYNFKKNDLVNIWTNKYNVSDDINLHNEGWTEYAEFPISYGIATDEEKKIVEASIALNNLNDNKIDTDFFEFIKADIDLGSAIDWSKDIDMNQCVLLSDATFDTYDLSHSLFSEILGLSSKKFIDNFKNKKFLIYENGNYKVLSFDYKSGRAPQGAPPRTAKAVVMAKTSTKNIVKYSNTLNYLGVVNSYLQFGTTIKAYTEGKISNAEYNMDLVMIGVGAIAIVVTAEVAIPMIVISGLYFIIKDYEKENPGKIQEFLNERADSWKKFEEITGERFWRITP